MRLDQSRESENVEDRRSNGGRAAVAMGGGSLLILLIAMLFGADPRQLMRMFEANAPAQRAPADPNAPPVNDEQTVFIRKVLGETEDVWNQIFARARLEYEEPQLVLFSGQVQSACGFASAAMGPFYCPADRKLYLDTTFFQELSAKHGAAVGYI
ncbi:MAG: neutral zinc metallopeptidase [Planctomycetota bacterium]|nr:neutral zinc metallopeptidase [Planctomycetota bacterium]